MSWLSSLFAGSNPTLSQTMGQTGALGGFASSLGQQNLTAGSNFWNSILSGDSSKISQALAPAINSAKGQASQENKTQAEFGTRSGGTAASTAARNDTVHGQIADLIGSLTGNAASELTSSGQNLINTGLNAFNQQAQMSQEQIQNWQQSLFGGAFTGGLGIGLGSAAKAAGLGF